MCVKRLADEATGASLVEYALLIGLIALACIAATGALGTGVLGVYQEAVGEVQSITAPGDTEGSGGSSGPPGEAGGWDGTGHWGDGG